MSPYQGVSSFEVENAVPCPACLDKPTISFYEFGGAIDGSIHCRNEKTKVMHSFSIRWPLTKEEDGAKAAVQQHLTELWNEVFGKETK